MNNLQQQVEVTLSFEKKAGNSHSSLKKKISLI